MLALIEMPSGKLLRLPEHWQEYRKSGSVEYPKGECQIGSHISSEENYQ
jgi:hypothetical protein